MISLPTPLLLPYYNDALLFYNQAGSLFYSTATLSAAGHMLGAVFAAPRSGTIKSVGFATATVGTGDTLRVSLQDVGSTGEPDGSADQYRDVVIGSADDNTWIETGILSSDGTDGGTKRAVTAGDMLAVVFSFASFSGGSIGMASHRGVGSRSGGLHTARLRFHNGSSWGAATYLIPMLVLRYDDDTLAPVGITHPTTNTGTLSIHAGTTPDEIGMRFVLPFSARFSGWWFCGEFSEDFSLCLYDPSGLVTSRTVESSALYAATQGQIWSPNPQLLRPGVEYIVSVKPAGAGGLCQVPYYDAPDADLSAICPGGPDLYYAARVDDLTWTTDSLRRLAMGPMIDAIGGQVRPTNRGEQ